MRPCCRTGSVADKPHANGEAATDTHPNSKADADADADTLPMPMTAEPAALAPGELPAPIAADAPLAGVRPSEARRRTRARPLRALWRAQCGGARQRQRDGRVRHTHSVLITAAIRFLCFFSFFFLFQAKNWH